MSLTSDFASASVATEPLILKTHLRDKDAGKGYLR